MKITSATNPRIKQVVALHSPKGRKDANCVIIEGKRALSTALSHLTLVTLFTTEKNLSYAQSLTDKIMSVPDSLMEKISTTKTPSGLLGVFELPKSPSPDQLTPGLVLADITDPGNMGTLIRTAAACNISSVVIIEGCDPWSPKVVHASAGTISLVKIFHWSWEELQSYKKELVLSALVVSQGEPPSHIDPSKSLIIVGNEAHGIPSPWLKQCDQLITLPMPGETESLNASIAGSIALYLGFVQKRP